MKNAGMYIVKHLLKITGLDIDLCPCCKKGKLIFKEKILRKAYSPPEKTKTIA